jgi:hypothetical protein
MEYKNEVEKINEIIAYITTPDYGDKEVADKIIMNLLIIKKILESENIDRLGIEEKINEIEYDLIEFDETAPANPDPQLKKFSHVRGLLPILKMI